MDNQRLFLFIALSLVLLLIWQAWQRDYGTAPPPPPAPGKAAAPETTAPAVPDLPTALPPAAAPSGAPGTPAAVAPAGGRIHVQTDLLDVVLGTVGGDIERVELRRYPNEVGNPHPFVLLNDTLPDLFISQTGLLADPGAAAAPNHRATFEAGRQRYELAPGAHQLQVRLRWTGSDGLQVVKVYTFERGSYVVDLHYEVSNPGDQPWSGRAYLQLQRTEVAEKGQSSFIHTYLGGVLYSAETKYQKIPFKQMTKEPLNRTLDGGWVAMLQHYFVAAWIPPQDAKLHYYTKVVDASRYVIGYLTPERTVAPHAQETFTSRLYVGPTQQDRLAAVAPGLELTVDYGYLTFLAQPIFWLLQHIHNLVRNWGWSIILLTVLIKLAFYKLSETSYKSMANMRRMQPRLQALKERYGDDRQRLNQAMMDMYKKERINPLGGCLPIVVQIPVFIALYWVLLESVELRHAHFVLWLNDLSSADPYYVLPLLMGVTMLIQQRLNPAPMDPIQQKVMMVLPVVFTVFFAFFPSGLVLYWLVNNTLSIAQQWVITRRIEAAAKPA